VEFNPNTPLAYAPDRKVEDSKKGFQVRENPVWKNYMKTHNQWSVSTAPRMWYPQPARVNTRSAGL